MKRARQLLGKRLFELAMRTTFYGHFVAGADQNEASSIKAFLAPFFGLCCQLCLIVPYMLPFTHYAHGAGIEACGAAGHSRRPG